MLASMTAYKLAEAALFAAERHQGQWRDGEVPVPYVCHPIEVLSLVRYTGQVTDLAVLCAAALHDTVENTQTTAREIRDRFGKPVADLVKELTRQEPSAEQTSGLDKDAVWDLRSRMLLTEIAEMSPQAQCVKLADRLSNLREARYTKKGKKLERYLRQTKEILKTVPPSSNPGLWKALEAEQRAMEK